MAAAMKVATYIIDNITASLEGRAAILVIMVVETFKTNVIVLHW